MHMKFLMYYSIHADTDVESVYDSILWYILMKTYPAILSCAANRSIFSTDVTIAFGDDSCGRLQRRTSVEDIIALVLYVHYTRS